MTVLTFVPRPQLALAIIVNVGRIKELLPSFHGECTIVLGDGTRLQWSREYSERLQAIIKGHA